MAAPSPRPSVPTARAGRATTTVDLYGFGSSDPDAGDALSYLWNFGDGTATDTTTAKTRHTYSTKGTYSASLRVRNDHSGLSDPPTVRIDVGNEAPQLTIASSSAACSSGWPADNPLQRRLLPGGRPAAGKLAYLGDYPHRHGSHTNLAFSETGKDLTFTVPPSENLSAIGAGNYLEVGITATESEGPPRRSPKHCNLTE